MFLAKTKDIFLSVFFPSFCVNCQRYLNQDDSSSICIDCFNRIRINNTFFCPICRNRLAENKKTCHPQADYFLAAAGDYNDMVLQNLIHHFKYKNLKSLTPILSKLMINYFKLINQSTDRLTSYILV